MRLLIILFISLSIPHISIAQEKLSLDDAIRIALQRNSQLNISKNEITQNEASLTRAYGRFLPTLSAYGNWSWNRSEEKGRTVNFEGFVQDLPPADSETRNYGVGANSNITLFDGLANYANLSASRNSLIGSSYQLEYIKQQVVFQTMSLYYTIVEADQILKVRDENVKQQKKNLETIEERNRLGSVTLADVYQQQVQLGNAELDIIRQKNILETAKSNLLYYLGLDVLEQYQYAMNLTDKELSFLNSSLESDFEELNELVSLAFKNRKDYASMLSYLEASYDRVTIAQSGHLPRLSGNLGFGTSANNPGNLFESKNYNAGLTLSLPIFTGFSVSSDVEIAEVSAMNMEIEKRDFERRIKQEIQKSYLDLEAARKGIKVTQNNVSAAGENLKIEQEKYNLGAGKLLDVLIASTSYQNALTNFINSQFLYIRLSEQLKYNIGVLDFSQYE